MNRQPLRAVTEAEVETYQRDGVVCLRQLLDLEWIELLRGNVQRYLDAPSGVGHDAAAGTGRFQLDYHMWTVDPEQRRFVFDSPIGEVAARLMRSHGAWLTVDLMLVKEPHTGARTPWHEDTLYAWYEGSQMISFWVGLDRVTLESGAVEYVRGSHKWGKAFKPKAFSGRVLDVEGGRDDVPDIDADRSAYDIVHFETEPGDVIASHLGVLHAAPGNSSSRRRRAIAFRYGGDDCRYIVRRGAMRPIREPGLRPGDHIGCELFPQVWPQRAVEDA